MSEQDMGEVSDGYHTFNELYEHRHMLLIALMISNPDISFKSRRHSDDSNSYDGWFLAGMTLPCGQITYHLPNRLFDACRVVELYVPPKYDGHTPADLVDRLSQWIKQ